MTYTKINVYEKITNRIIASLEKGEVPWRKPWTTKMPMNLITKKAYQGINHMLLGMSDFESPYWLTFKQARDLGGKVKKGEKATFIVFWKFVEVKEEDKEEEEKITKVPFLRYYNVFNADQCEGLKLPKAEKELKFSPVEKCEKIVEGYEDKPKIVKSGQAWFNSMTDEIGIPSAKTFKSIPEYYSTLFHELVHSTGSKNRLNREGVINHNSFGSEDYSKEELVAEIGASFLAYETGISVRKLETNTTAYIQGWLSRLQGDQKFVITASGQAQKAVNYIKGEKVEK